MLITALDYLKINPAPSEEQTRDAISAVLCRCTGYVNIVKAVKAGAEAMRRIQSNERSRPQHIGRSLLRREDRRLLTGRGQFIVDLELGAQRGKPNLPKVRLHDPL